MDLGMYIFIIGVAIFIIGKQSIDKNNQQKESNSICKIILNYIEYSEEFRMIHTKYGKVFMVIGLLYILLYQSKIAILIVFLIVISWSIYFYSNIKAILKYINIYKI